MKKEVPLAIALVVAVIQIAEYYLSIPALVPIAATIRNWVVLISAMIVPLGAINLMRVQLPAITNKKPGWIYGTTTLAFMFTTIVLGLNAGATSTWYRLGIDRIMAPAGATIYALLAFFIASAAYRAFRFRNLDSSILLVTALIAMIGNAPIGGAISSFFPKAVDWITNIPNTAGQRGLIITAAVGFIAVSLRSVTGYNRQWLGGSKE